MKKLIDTKPKNKIVDATEEGWVDVETGELLVAIKNLKGRLGDDINTLAKRGRGRPKKIKD